MAKSEWVKLKVSEVAAANEADRRNHKRIAELELLLKQARTERDEMTAALARMVAQ